MKTLKFAIYRHIQTYPDLSSHIPPYTTMYYAMVYGCTWTKKAPYTAIYQLKLLYRIPRGKFDIWLKHCLNWFKLDTSIKQYILI
jgi:hypothetical protein